MPHPSQRSCVLAIALALLWSLPALAHGDMAAKAIIELVVVVIGGSLLVLGAGLAVLAVILHRRGATTASAVFRHGLAGVGAIVFLGLGLGAIVLGYDNTPPAAAFLFAIVPALLAAQLLVSASQYRRIDARSLRVGSIVLAALFLLFALVSALVALGAVMEASSPSPNYVSGEVRGYQRGCEQNNGSDCNMLGLRLSNGSGIKRDAPAAVDAFDKACRLRTSIGCRNLAGILDGHGGVPRDDARAKRAQESYDALDASPRAQR